MSTQKEKVMHLPKFNPKDLGSIIGPNKNDCEKKPFLRNRPSLRKNVLTKAWESYKLYKEKENVEGDIPKVFIQLSSDGEKVLATIKTDSEQMMKFTQFHLNKYQEDFRPPVKKSTYTLYASIEHRSIPQLIGRRASRISAIRTAAVSNMDEENEPEELQKCEKSFLKIDPFNVRGEFSEFTEKIRDSERSNFVGWPPEEGEEIVKIYISSLASGDSFVEFVDNIIDELSENIREICENQKRFDSKKEEELKECYEALETDYD